MKRNLSLIVVIVLILFTRGVYAVIPMTDCLLETVFIKLPNYKPTQWKEIYRTMDAKIAQIEWIPANQTPHNWSELIAVQFFDKTSEDLNISGSIDAIAERIRKTATTSYPKNTVTWKIIEKNEDDIIYEWILHKQDKDTPPQHDIARLFLTHTGLHRIAFTRKNAEMSISEKQKWFNLLKGTSIISLEAAAKRTDGLSMITKQEECLELGPIFSQWRATSIFNFEDVTIHTRYIPLSQIEERSPESLEISIMADWNTVPLDELFEKEKNGVQEGVAKKVDFEVLKKSPTEIIYSYSHPKEFLQLNAVVRTFVSLQGYHRISYKRETMELLKKEEILEWQKTLEFITHRKL